MGAAGTGLAGYSMLPPRNCVAQPPAAQSLPLGAAAGDINNVDPCPRSSSNYSRSYWYSRSSYSDRSSHSGWWWGSRSQSTTPRTSFVSGRGAVGGTRSVSRGGFGSTGHSISSGS
jgi:hypothetical protein